MLLSQFSISLNIHIQLFSYSPLKYRNKSKEVAHCGISYRHPWPRDSEPGWCHSGDEMVPTGGHAMADYENFGFVIIHPRNPSSDKFDAKNTPAKIESAKVDQPS